MKSHMITGGGSTKLHLVETGNPNGRPILFIHGFSQCSLAWSRQLESDLANDFRLVAMDLRGHGFSDNPRDDYGESKNWADDVNAAMQTLGLEHPIFSGWSYGPLLIFDYIRHYGEAGIGGIQMIGGISKLASDPAGPVTTPAFLSLVPGFFATDVETSVQSLEALLRLCLKRDPSDAERYLMLGYCLCVPPYVRQALLSRSFDNHDLLPKIRKPVLITHGTDDRIIKSAAADRHQANMPHAQLHMMANTGHPPFWDDAAGFNARLRAFAGSL